MPKDREDIDAIKASLSITAVAERLGHSVVRGKMHCPFARRHAHGDRTPSVSVSEERGLFNCWVCQDVRGDVIHLVEICNGCSFTEALQWLRDEFPEAFKTAGEPRPRTNSQPRAAAIRDISGDIELRSGDDPRPAPKPSAPEIRPEDRDRVILDFLAMLSPVEDVRPVAGWLARRRIFRPAWQKMKLRCIGDYERVNSQLSEKYPMELLQGAGLFNDKGHLRYYKHPLIFPYFDSTGVPRYFQARAIDAAIQPKELNLRGTVPFPYNVSILDGKPGWVYLCEGVVDTLTLIGRNFETVGIPGVKSFKKEWLGLFRNKSVVTCLDQDEAGRAGTAVISGLFNAAGIRNAPLGEGVAVDSFKMREGQDINDWYGGHK